MRRKDTRSVYNGEDDRILVFSVSTPDHDGQIEVFLTESGSVWLDIEEAIELHTALGLALGMVEADDA